jgi:hypothetical protein
MRNRYLLAVFVLLSCLSQGCVVPKYDNPFLKVNYDGLTNMSSEEFEEKLSYVLPQKDHDAAEAIFTSALVDRNYLAILTDPSGLIELAFDKTMIGKDIREVFVSGTKVWDHRLVGSSVGYFPFKFNGGYFWVHLAISHPEKISHVLVEMAPVGKRMYGENNPLF